MMDKQKKDWEQSCVHSSSTETLHSVYLHSDDSINVNLREESKEEMEYFRKPRAEHIYLNCVHMNK